MKAQKKLYNLLGKVFLEYDEDEINNTDKIKSSGTVNFELQAVPDEPVNENEFTESIISDSLLEGTKDTKYIEEIKKNDDFVESKGVNTMATCTGENCSECCAIFTNSEKRAAFGYQIESAVCECHDICVEDVRDICVEERTLTYCIPCNPNGRAGCRGGFLPDGPPAVQSWRVLCADENLSPATNCDRIINNIEFEVVLRYSSAQGNTLVVVTPKDVFDCFWHEFARFPSGTRYANNTTGLNQFRNELAQIDGSCKVIIIESVRVNTSGNDCLLIIEYKVIDKLWKHENLLVSAIKPYVGPGEISNITVSQEFGQGHQIVACTNSGPCAGLPTID